MMNVNRYYIYKDTRILMIINTLLDINQEVTKHDKRKN